MPWSGVALLSLAFRRSLAPVLLTLVFGVLGMSGAQPPASATGIGFLGTATASNPQFQAFRRGLRDLGWIEGQNLVIESRSEGALAAELVRRKVAVIVTGALGVQIAKSCRNRRSWASRVLAMPGCWHGTPLRS
jgi:putative ABC transport system substrate-binding protein